MDTEGEISQEDQREIMDFIINCVDVPQTLRKLSENLYNSYETRKKSFETNKGNNSTLKNKFLIPLSKMNNEERIFYSLLTESNLKNELPYILEYVSSLYDGILLAHKIRNPSEDLEQNLTMFVTTRGLVTYFSTLMKRFHEKEFEEEEEKVTETPKKERSKEEIEKEIEELCNHPLFMQELPKDIENNKHLQAIQALQYEGKPEDVALDLIDKSKERLKVFHTSKNRKFLKEAMIHICNAIDHVEGDEKIPDEVKFQVFLHRSDIQLLVKNWGYAILDLKDALRYKFDEETAKKVIQCYINLENYEKAKESTVEYLKVFITNKEVLNKSETLNKMLSYIDSLIREDQEKTEKFELFKNLSNSEKLHLYKTLKSKGIKMKPQIHNIPQNYASKIYVDEEGLLHFPILIIYEEFNYTDYIQDFPENGLIQDILDILFQEKLPWDKENKYSLWSAGAYYEISEQSSKEYCRYYPLRNDDTLIDVLKNKKVYLNGLPVLTIVSQFSSYFQHFIKTKIILKR